MKASGALGRVTIGDVLELLDTEARVHGAARSDSAACYRLLRQTIFGPAAPARLRQLSAHLGRGSSVGASSPSARAE